MVKSFLSSLAWLTVALLLAGAARAAAPEVNVVSGVLITADGKPVGGATVVLHGRGKFTTTTDPAGHFRFENAPPKEGGYEIDANRDNLRLDHTIVHPLPGSKLGAGLTAPLRLTVREALRVKFTVIANATGKPLPGSRVWVAAPQWHKIFADTGGVATAEGLQPTEQTANIFADGYARKAIKFDLSGTTGIDRETVAMDPGGIVRGVVVDQAGKPIEGVNVNYYFTGSPGTESPEPNWTGDKESTGTDGKFQERFAPLDAPFGIQFAKNGFALQDSGDKIVTLTRAKPLAELRIVMQGPPRNGSVTGTVTDTAGRPIAGAHVVKLARGGGDDATTDAKGRFRLDEISEQKFRGSSIGIVASGFAPKAIDAAPGTAEHPSEIAIQLEPGHTLRGQVVDEHGKPVPRVQVRLYSNSYPRPLQFAKPSTTGDDGKFVFDSLPADVRANFTTEFGQYVGNVELPLDKAQPVLYTIETPGAIRARLVDAATDKPVAAFHVRLDYSPEMQSNELRPSAPNAEWWHPGVSVRSDDGTFTIHPLPNNSPVQMVIDAEGYERNIVPHAVARHADQSTELKIVMLPLESSDYSTLSGRFVDFRGRGIAGVRLHLIAASREYLGPNDPIFRWDMIDDSPVSEQACVVQYIASKTDADGRFKFEKIPPEQYLQLLYQSDTIPRDRWTGHDKTRPGATRSIMINIPQPASIHGTIDRKRYADAQELFVYRNDNYGDASQQQSVFLGSSQSKFEFNNLTPGQYYVQLNSKPRKVTQNGQTFFQSVGLETQQLNLSPGQDYKISLP